MIMETMTADPDIEQAISDFLPFAAEIRDRSARVQKLKPGSDARRAEAGQIRHLMNDIETRAMRIGITGEALMVLLNDALDARARRGRGAPARPTSRSLLTNLLNAEKAAEAEVSRCASALVAAQQAYSTYAGGKLVDAEAA
jgi:hypothetical protein